MTIEDVLWKLYRDGSPVAVIVYADGYALEHVLDTVRALKPKLEKDVLRVANVEGALEQPDHVVVLVPDDEDEAVRMLELRRDVLLERSAPLVLCLVRGGAGASALQEAPSLASVLRGRSADDPDEIDAEAAASEFHDDHGLTPQEWLERWHRGEVADTIRARHILADALLLEGP